MGNPRMTAPDTKEQEPTQRLRPGPLAARWAGLGFCLVLAQACGSNDASVDGALDGAVDGALDGAVDGALGDAGIDGLVADAEPAVDLRPVAPAPYPRPSYRVLSETGLFAGPGFGPTGKEVAPGLQGFQPAFQLWSDGADKRRWVSLPPSTRIDTSEMDHWVFPVGTRLWKEFSHGGVRLETRLIERYGDGPEDYWMGAFVWTADQSEAVLAVDGALDINGTAHDAPAAKLCGSCHRGETGRVLGVSAIQLSHPGPGLTVDGLAQAGLLSHPPAAPASFGPETDPTTRAALGYLHANCGHCHNPQGASWPDTQVVLRLSVAERVPQTTALWKTVVGQRLTYWRHPTLTHRVVAGQPEASALWARMNSRGSRDQMPSLATERVDNAGLAALAAWIAALPDP